jgi:hypothetical protein
MKELLNYVLFSGVEYFFTLVLAMSLFNYKIKYYIVELLITTFSITLFSYLLVKLDLVIMITSSIPLISCILFILLFKIKISISVRMTAGGFLGLAICQMIIGLLSSLTNIATISEWNNYNDIKINLLQLNSGILLFLISYNIYKMNSGFGSAGNNSTKLSNILTLALIIPIVLSGVFLYFSQSKHLPFLIIASLILTFLTFFILMKKQENEEYLRGGENNEENNYQQNQ